MSEAETGAEIAEIYRKIQAILNTETERQEKMSGTLPITKRRAHNTRRSILLVGAAGFEPTTSSTPLKRATKLRHAPNNRRYCSKMGQDGQKVTTQV